MVPLDHRSHRCYLADPPCGEDTGSAITESTQENDSLQSSASLHLFLILLPLFPVFARTGIWGQGGDNRRRLHPRWEKCDHHEPSHPSGLDVPVVLSAQVQLPPSGEDLPQGCAEGCARLWCVSRFIISPSLLIQDVDVCYGLCLLLCSNTAGWILEFWG